MGPIDPGAPDTCAHCGASASPRKKVDRTEGADPWFCGAEKCRDAEVRFYRRQRDELRERVRHLEQRVAPEPVVAEVDPDGKFF